MNFPFLRLPGVPLYGKILLKPERKTILDYCLIGDSMRFNSVAFCGKLSCDNFFVSMLKGFLGTYWCSAVPGRLSDRNGDVLLRIDLQKYNCKKSKNGDRRHYIIFRIYNDDTEYTIECVRSIYAPLRTLLLCKKKHVIMKSFPDDAWNIIHIVKPDFNIDLLLPVFSKYCFDWNILRHPRTFS